MPPCRVCSFWLSVAALDEILTDMDGGGSCSSLRMFRLLQGDVGSGKTAVAFLAMLKAAGQGAQSCMLAPTEVLTMQHLQVRVHAILCLAPVVCRADCDVRAIYGWAFSRRPCPLRGGFTARAKYDVLLLHPSSPPRTRAVLRNRAVPTPPLCAGLQC